jgi:4-hydroxy-tetrahydrodipicolinate synthase
MISVATPATPEGDLDLDAYRRNIRFMLDRGVATGNGVLLVAAAGGEFPMLSVDQRKQLMKVAVETAGDRVAIAASIQSNSTAEAIDLAVYAREVGVAIGQLSAPYYYPPTETDIVRFFSDVASRSGLPIMIYNNWWNTSNMNSRTIVRLAEIEEAVAVKWSAPTNDQYAEGYELFRDRLAIIDNSGQLVLARLLGATGFVTHISNFWPEHPMRVWELMQADAFYELMDALTFDRQWGAWTEAVMEYTEGEGPFIKGAMDAVGLASGDPFLPGLPVTAELRESIARLLADFSVPSAAGFAG